MSSASGSAHRFGSSAALSMMGTMLFVVANGSGPMRLDSWLTKRSAPAEKPALFAQAE